MRTNIFVYFVALLLSPIFCQAQDKPKGSIPIISLNGVSSPAGARATISKIQLINDGRLIANDPGTVIKSFVVSFQLEGQNLLGPYQVQGAALPEHIKDQLKKFNILVAYFENIVVDYQGKEKITNSVIVNCAP